MSTADKNLPNRVPANRTERILYYGSLAFIAAALAAALILFY